jgi:DNA-binding transcriptional regulator GbsR (MarR family)
MNSSVEKTISNFVERMGLIAQADGMPRIAGRILGMMIVHGGPFSFADLAERLQVSRASISTNTRLLESLGVIERTGVPGERQDYFRMRPHPYARMLQGYVERMRRARELVDETQAALPQELGGAHDRLEELDAFYDMLIESFESVVEKWEARRAAPQAKAKEPAAT